MKKYLVLITLTIILMAVTGCGNSGEKDNPDPVPQPTSKLEDVLKQLHADKAYEDLKFDFNNRIVYSFFNDRNNPIQFTFVDTSFQKYTGSSQLYSSTNMNYELKQYALTPVRVVAGYQVDNNGQFTAYGETYSFNSKDIESVVASFKYHNTDSDTLEVISFKTDGKLYYQLFARYDHTYKLDEEKLIFDPGDEKIEFITKDQASDKIIAVTENSVYIGAYDENADCCKYADIECTAKDYLFTKHELLSSIKDEIYCFLFQMDIAIITKSGEFYWLYL